MEISTEVLVGIGVPIAGALLSLVAIIWRRYSKDIAEARRLADKALRCAQDVKREVKHLREDVEVAKSITGGTRTLTENVRANTEILHYLARILPFGWREEDQLEKQELRKQVKQAFVLPPLPQPPASRRTR